ncbi:carboxymuconolactone decarboxylase family protein [Halobium palmae]|uniref:Carboxymuconolactone decarboxylase family protein n=1 Tax=Halobium palmae TaxID=1776492 RepID=A0ABD5RVD8_9EURY
MLSNSPSVIAARVDYFRQLMTGGTVPAREKELAYFTVGLVTGTTFVAATHGRYLVEEHGLDEATAGSIARGELSELGDRDRAVVSFARAVTRDPTAVSDVDFETLRSVGYDDENTMELLLLTCEAQTAATIVAATGMALADRDESPPPYLPASFDL